MDRMRHNFFIVPKSHNKIYATWLFLFPLFSSHMTSTVDVIKTMNIVAMTTEGTLEQQIKGDFRFQFLC